MNWRRWTSAFILGKPKRVNQVYVDIQEISQFKHVWKLQPTNLQLFTFQMSKNELGNC